MKKKVIIGIEKLISKKPDWINGKKIGLLLNPASIDSSYCHTKDLINKHFPGQLTAIYTPQHGYCAAKQDNMIESEDFYDKELDIPVFSLYGKTRIPTEKMLKPIDILLIDIQDVGTRVYTFIYTMSYCMEAAKKFGKKIVILDRPNPIGQDVEGNCLDLEYASFVGRFPIPMRHGLTIAELALLFNKEFQINCDLEIIEMEGWKRSMYFDETGLPWVAPSPNMPTIETAIVYPGQVIWEGTNVSEGRGTTQPFELFGSPYLDLEKIENELGELPGLYLRRLCFEPTFNKWHNDLCHGFQIHVINRKQYKPYLTSLKILQAIIKSHPDEFQWKEPPYEYEFKKRPIDLILGSKLLRKNIENLQNVHELESQWTRSLNSFLEMKQQYHLYS